MTPESPDSRPPDTFEHPPRPQLRIIHFLVWMACSGLILATQQFFPVSPRMPDALWYFSTAMMLLYGGVYGACIGGAIFVIAAQFRPLRARLAPGHWLLIAEAAASVVGCVAFTLMLAPRRFEDPYPVYFLSLAVLEGAIVLVFLIVALILRDELRWNIAFLLLAVLNLVGMVLYGLCAWRASEMDEISVAASFLPSAEVRLALVSCVLIAVVALLDWRRRTPRDGLHWVGIANHIATNMIVVIRWVAIVLLV